jgi:hypothetical protein
MKLTIALKKMYHITGTVGDFLVEIKRLTPEDRADFVKWFNAMSAPDAERFSIVLPVEM